MEASPLRVMEFYAGVGGTHYAFLASGINFEIVASIDINTNTNHVYKHNFPSTPHLNRNICGMTAAEMDSLKPDMFTMSPPCQPFTRQGHRRDNFDRRTDSFFHLMQLLTEMHHPPTYLFVENVQGFELSNTRENFVAILKRLGYKFQEFLLSPMQFGIPNSRLRFYLLAKRSPFSLTFLKQPCRDVGGLITFLKWSADNPRTSNGQDTQGTAQVVSRDVFSDSNFSPSHEKQETPAQSSVEPETDSLEGTLSLQGQETSSFDKNCAPPTVLQPQAESSGACCFSQPIMGTTATVIRPLSCYLTPLSDAELEMYLVPEKTLMKYATGFDIVQPSSNHSCCFTRAYGHYAVGTGSILQHAVSEDLDKAFQEFLEHQKEGEGGKCLRSLQVLKLRYFSPREVANLMCFPPGFAFPPDLTLRQRYKVIGNSLNVHVVSVLLQYLFS